DVPGADDDASRVGVGADQLERAADLVDALAVCAGPGSPLPAIDRAELTLWVRPFVPDADAVFPQPRDVGLAPQEPQQLDHHRSEVDFLGGDQRKALRQIAAK